MLTHKPSPLTALLGCAILAAYACHDESPTEVVLQAGVPSLSAVAADAPGMIHACFIPGSGMVYRTDPDGADGLPTECKGNNHVAFSWQASLVLAGQSCPAGHFMTGVDASGKLVCAEPSKPPTPMPEVCNGLDDDLDGTVDEGLFYCFDGAPAPHTDGVRCDLGYQDADGIAANGCEQPVGPSPEVCNGADDDLDGQVDEELRYCNSGIPAPNTDGDVCLSGYYDIDQRISNGCEVSNDTPAPEIHEIEPRSIPVNAWSVVNIYGVHFVEGATVDFPGMEGDVFVQFNSDTHLIVTVVPRSTGVFDAVVETLPFRSATLREALTVTPGGAR